jgi:hypothetical protein
MASRALNIGRRPSRFKSRKNIPVRRAVSAIRPRLIFFQAEYCDYLTVDSNALCPYQALLKSPDRRRNISNRQDNLNFHKNVKRHKVISKYSPTPSRRSNLKFKSQSPILKN